MRVTRNYTRADRIRAAICITLVAARGEPMRIAQLVAAIERFGIPLGAHPNKIVADAIRWEVLRRHVRRAGWGAYAIDHLPRSTEYHMRKRVESYASNGTARRAAPP
jgi:hypothetical protein